MSGWHHGIAGLRVKGDVYNGQPVVVGQWDRTGFGLPAVSMRRAAEAILRACDDAEAAASTETELST